MSVSFVLCAHVCLLVIKALSLIFAVLTTVVSGVSGSTGMPKMIQKVLVRPFGVKVAEMSRVTAGTSVAPMLQEQSASAVTWRVRMENVSRILAADNVSSGTQAILTTLAVELYPTTVLQLKEVAQETRYPIFGIFRVINIKFKDFFMTKKGVLIFLKFD